MFDAIRNQKKILMGVLLILVVPAFVLFGVDGYTRMAQNSEAVAEVGGKDVKKVDWEAAHRQYVERVRASNPNVDAKLLDTEAARYATLENLVRERVLSAAAQDMHLYTSDQKLSRELSNNPTIAALRTADGKLDVEAYKALLGRQGMTPEMFEAGLRGDLSRAQVLEGVGSTTLASKAVSQAALDAFFQQRVVRVQTFKPAAYAAKVAVTDADLKAYYSAHEAQFKTPEQADVQYVVLDMGAVEKQIALNPADVKAFYEQNVARLSGPEERRARHVLLSVAADANAQAKAKVREKALSLLKTLKDNPQKFPDIAKEHSQDPGSAAKGGDLDFFARGAMVKAFEEAAFALPKGGISDVVESEFGFHIIQVTDIRAPKQKPFEELRAGIEADLKRQEAQKKYAEMTEQFSNLAYEQSSSLQPIADKLKLEIRSAKAVLREPQGAVADPMWSNPRLLQALFASDTIQNKRNTEAIELGPNRLIAARVERHLPTRTQTLDEVKATVQQRFVAAKSAELARAEGAALWQAAKNGQAPAALGAETTVSREHPGEIAPKVLDAIMSTPSAQLPAWTGVDLGEQGYALVQLVRVTPRQAAPAERAQAEQAQFRQWMSNAERNAVYEILKQRYKVKILLPAPKQG